MSGCKIHMVNPNSTVLPGSEIRGILECNFYEETKIRCIKVILKCKEINQWTKTERYKDTSNRTKTKNVEYRGENDIVHMEYILLSPASRFHILSRGKYTYPFYFRLPPNIPSTFNGPFGSISYKLQGYVVIKCGLNYEDACYFKVNAPIDFNKMPVDIQKPASFSIEKTVCSWSCRPGEITMDVELPKKAFTLGETIKFKVDVSNMSNTNMEKLYVILSRKIIYRATSPSCSSQESQTDIISLCKCGVSAYAQRTYNLQMTIPRFNFIPNFTRSRLFDVSYLLKVYCKMPFSTFNLNMNIKDIVLGHVSWGQSAKNYSPVNYSSHLQSGFLPNFSNIKQSQLSPNAPTNNSRPSAPLMEELPPSYEEILKAYS